jgi:hypothetical protein
MAYSDSGTVLRGDINVLVEEASAATKNLIGLQALPPFGVDEQSGQYPVFKKGKGQLLNNDVTNRSPGGSYGRVERSYENDTYDCVDRGLEELVDDTYVKNVARYFSAESTAAKHTMQQVLLGHEVRAEAAIMNTTNFGSGTAAAVAYTEANIATIDFPQDILAAVERMHNNAEEANTIIMSSSVWERVRRATLTQNFMRGSQPTDATLLINSNLLAGAFASEGIEQILVGRARVNSAKKGQSYSASNVWSDTYVWVGKVSGGDFSNQGAGRTLVWNREGGTFVTETYRDEKRRSNVVRVRQNTAEKIIDGAAGTLITTSYS